MNKYPVREDVVQRPFRLWHDKEKRALPWRCYKYHENARIGAWIEAKHAKIGVTIEVIDVRYGTMLGQYTRRIKSVTFQKETHNVKDPK